MYIYVYTRNTYVDVYAHIYIYTLYRSGASFGGKAMFRHLQNGHVQNTALCSKYALLVFGQYSPFPSL